MIQCDLSMEMFSLELEMTILVVKFKDEPISSDDKISFYQLDQIVLIFTHCYEIIILAVPQKKVHPGIENGSLKSEIIEKLKIKT